MRARKRQHTQKGKGNHQGVGNHQQEGIPKGSCCCNKSIEGDLGQRAEGLGSSFKTGHNERLSDATQSAQSTNDDFIAL